ncbi:MAG: hypothetical protein ACI9KK_000927 [Ascidiaceihabitans sp.]
MHCTGGFRAAEVIDGKWQVEPILVGGTPSAKGFISRKELQVLLERAQLMPIAFERIGWTNGLYHSSWVPIVPNKENHFRGPSDLWGSISTNLSKTRTDDALNRLSNPSIDEVGAILDARTREEALAQSISLSLRSMDISVSRIAEFYNEQAVNLSASGQLDGQRSSTSLDQTLYTHVHSFFLQLGAARDYLGAYIALKIGLDSEKVDDMARLTAKLRTESFGQEAVLDLLLEKGYLIPKLESLNKSDVAGWLKDVSALRKEFVHKRPYGSKFAEALGFLVPISTEAGLFRYFRPISLPDGSESDVLDVIVQHYRACNELFQNAADRSEQDTAILTLTGGDVISIEVKVNQQ